MEFLNSIITIYNIPVLSAFLLGVMTSISPCPLATNITAIAYISKDIKTAKHTMLNGLFYTLGRGLAYTVLAALIFGGVSTFSIANIFEGWGNKILGPVLIFISLLMFGMIKVNFDIKSDKIEELKQWLVARGYIGSILLGFLFALAFCPYSGVLFFGVLIPLILTTGGGLILAPVFALGTGIPVIIFSFLIVISLEKLGQGFKMMQKIEKVMRYLVASVFMITGVYYLSILLKFLLT